MLIATTTLVVTRPVATGDPYEAAYWSDIADNIPAHISTPPGTADTTGGDKEVLTAAAYVPVGTDIERSDLVIDDGTGLTYEVLSVSPRRGLGMDHLHLLLRLVKGGANG